MQGRIQAARLILAVQPVDGDDRKEIESRLGTGRGGFLSHARRLLPKQAFQVLAAMAHSHNANRLRRRVIGNQVGENRPEFDRLKGEIVTAMSGPRCHREEAKGPVNFRLNISCNTGIRIGQVVSPDVSKVLLGLRR